MGEGRDQANLPAPLPLTGMVTRFARDNAYAQQMWMTLASYMAGNGFTATQAQTVADEVQRRMELMRCSYGAAIASVWDDIKARRWQI